MNISPEKQKHYEQLYEEMYRESLRTGQTPIPTELNDLAERKNFLIWRHEFWVNLSHSAAATYRQWLDRQPASDLALAETPPPYRSKT